ncbi:Chaperone protein lpfB precursor [Escherichia coli]|uniref:Chaperone protein lpfB n=1 Tax=Escherichia coli TaxID=562 RepID=A0A376TR29_ECOLX|nr:Chaperone protein lpfB precursor [Escherichia coli]
MKRISFAVLALLMTAQQCFAGGVALSTTRVIYDGGKKEASLTVENHNKNEEFLIQSWIDDVNGNKKNTVLLLHRHYSNLILIKITSYVSSILKIPYLKIVNPFTGLM